jgi:hypothetical protein
MRFRLNYQIGEKQNLEHSELILLLQIVNKQPTRRPSVKTGHVKL